MREPFQNSDNGKSVRVHNESRILLQCKVSITLADVDRPDQESESAVRVDG